MTEIAVCVVNFNCLEDTKELIHDLYRQDYSDFSLYFYDQNSSENGTQEFLENLTFLPNATVIQNDHNRPLNHIWNDFAETAGKTHKYLTFLNNDVRIPRNYLEDTITVLSRDNRIGIAVHATNNRKYSQATRPTRHAIENTFIKQGWDFSLRSKDWIKIPTPLKFYCGDDFVFQKSFDKGLKTGVITSSPIIHKLSKTRKNMDTESANKIRNQANLDIATYKQLGFKHVWNNIPKQSNLEPQFNKVTELLSGSAKEGKLNISEFDMRLKQHLQDISTVPGNIVYIGPNDVDILKILHTVAVGQKKKLIIVDDSEFGIKGKNAITSSLPIGNNVIILDNGLMSDLDRIELPVSFVFFGTTSVEKVSRVLPSIWQKASPGTTLFFPKFHGNGPHSEASSSVNSFFADKKAQIIISRQQTKVGINDVYLAIKCFRSPARYKSVHDDNRPVTVACVLKMGGIYNEVYVNKLASAVRRHSTRTFEFVTLTDGDPKKIDMKVVDRVIPLELNLTGWWSKLELFRPELFSGTQVFYLDLDTLILDNIDDFLDYRGDFLGLRDFNTLVDFGSGIMGWNPEKTVNIFYKFIKGALHSKSYIQSHQGGDQEVIYKLNKLKLDWVQDCFPRKMAAFKYECYNESTRQVSYPPGTSIICFHSKPKMADLIHDPIIKNNWK